MTANFVYQGWPGAFPCFSIKDFGGQRPVRAVFTTRLGGVSYRPYDSLDLAYHTGDDPQLVTENRRLLCRSLEINLEQLATLNQVHGNRVLVLKDQHDLVSRGLLPQSAQNSEQDNTKLTVDQGIDRQIPHSGQNVVVAPDADAQITAQPGVALVCQVADCTAVYIYDPVRRVIALAHAGWRGTVDHLAGKCVRLMTSEYGCSPADCVAAISPSAGPCCYEVGDQVVEAVREHFPHQWKRVLRQVESNDNPGELSWRFDLWEANLLVLQDTGLKRENITVSGLCTICRQDLFFSYRGSGGVTGRMAAVFFID